MRHFERTHLALISRIIMHIFGLASDNIFGAGGDSRYPPNSTALNLRQFKRTQLALISRIMYTIGLGYDNIGAGGDS